MKLPFGVVDADGHIVEDENRLLREYLEKPYNEYLIDGIPDHRGWVGQGSGITDKSFMDTTLGGKLGNPGQPGYPSPQIWLDCLERGGLDFAVLYPTLLLDYSHIYDPDYLIALGKAYNNYVADEFLKCDQRLRAVALVPLLEVEESIKEMHRVIVELGFSGIFVPAVGFGLLGDKKFHSIYSEAEKLECLVAVHGGHATADHVPYTRFIQRHTVGFPVSNMIQMMHMTYEGVFEMFPNLKVAYLESGCTWAPYFLDRMDEEWEKRGWIEAKECKEKPSEYIKNRAVFMHAEPSETLLPQVATLLGENKLFFASDFPHWDNEFSCKYRADVDAG